MPTQVILLERVDKLGNMGEVVNVKPGYARNYLLPQNKALRATKENIAYFEAQKASLEKANAEKRKEAEKQAKKVDGVVITLIRQASESGQLFGSVSSRDISDAVSAKSGETVTRNQVTINNNFKTVGLFPVEIVLHPEVKVSVTVNIARSEDEAKQQEKTGKAVVASEQGPAARKPANDQAGKEDLLEDSALEAEAAEEQEEAERSAKEAAKAEAKAAKKAAKEEAPEAESEADAE